MLITKVPECQLQEAVAEYLEKQGFIVMPEVQFFTKRIDLFAVDRTSLATIAIEAKIRDWKRAITQARAYLLCADHVYIALPSDLAYNVATRGFNSPIGLLAVDTSEGSTHAWNVSIVIPASMSMLKKDEYLDRLRGTVLFARFRKRAGL